MLAVLYLIFNEGYAATEGPLVRVELCDEAIWLTRVLTQLLPERAGGDGPAGPHALAALPAATRARTPPADLVLLEDQDRASWDRAMIDEGIATLDRAMAFDAPGPYQVQAAIAALHAQALTARGHRLAADRVALRHARA